MSTTPYMSLLLPTVSVTLGPTYATENNTAFTTIDSHDHTNGKGVQVPSSGIMINEDLSFSDYNATDFRSLRLTENAAPLGLVTDVACLYASGVDLWFNDGSGNQIQLTAGGALNAASIGGIGGDYTTSTATVFYTASTKTFSFWQDTNKSALMDIGTILLRRVDNTSSAAITIKPSTSLSAGYTLTLPTAAPASISFVAVDASGNLSFTNSMASLALSGALSVGTTLDVTGAATLGSTLGVTGTTTLSGAAILSSTLSVTGAATLLNTLAVTGAITPASDATVSVGSASKNYVSLFLDHGATDGGAINFNAGTTSFLKSNATGLQLQVGGFSTFTPSVNAGAALGSAALRWDSLLLGTNIGTGGPDANRLYADLIPKAWAATTSGGSLSAGVNLTVSRSSTGVYAYLFQTAMANANYAVSVNQNSSLGGYAAHGTKLTTGFTVFTMDSGNFATDRAHAVQVIGSQ